MSKRGKIKAGSIVQLNWNSFAPYHSNERPLFGIVTNVFKTEGGFVYYKIKWQTRNKITVPIYLSGEGLILIY